MTTSGVTIYQLTRDNLIAAAMRKIGALAKGESPSSEDLTNGMQALNALIAEYQTLGMPIWKRVQYPLTLTATNTYTIGTGKTTDTPYPLKIDSAVLRRSGGSSQEMSPRARVDFNLLNTSSTGPPVEYTYQPFVNYGILKIWPTPDATNIASSTIELTYLSAIEGFTTAPETLDFPQEWQLAIIYGLAKLLAPEYGLSVPDQQNIAKQAKEHLDMAVEFFYENTSFFIQPREQ